MQRAGTGPAEPSETAGADEPFVSPWDVGSAPADEPERPVRMTAVPLGTKSPRAVTWSSHWRERCVASTTANHGLVEQFRRLAAVMQNAQATNGIRIVMMTSATPADGKTSTALNLGLVLSESYHRRVLLIDADLRRPSMGGLLELADVPGLGDALKAPNDQKLSVVQISPNLTLLPGGRPDPDPMRGLTSPRMQKILEDARERFDWVILDSPPTEPTADAQYLADMVDAIVFVIRAGQTQYAQAEKAIAALGRERILGVILNGVDQLPGEAYYYGMPRD
jgi:capsular exopolysaccharide synthesis family protein